MRSYGVIAPTYWTGSTGREIRSKGPLCQLVGVYLITAPSASMVGIYYLPLATLCHDVGISRTAVKRALDVLGDVGFAHYDHATEHVWIPEMARYQVGEELKSGDKRIRAIVRMLQSLKGHPFVEQFVTRYGAVFNLPDDVQALRSPLGGPSKPLRRGIIQDQDQDQDQKQDTPPTPSRGNGEACPDPSALTDLWNEVITSPKVLALTGKRLLTVKIRLREHPDPAWWRSVIERVAHTPFLRGAGPRGWIAGFDWLVQNDVNAVAVLEGKYDHASARDATIRGIHTVPDAAETRRRYLERSST